MDGTQGHLSCARQAQQRVPHTVHLQVGIRDVLITNFRPLRVTIAGQLQDNFAELQELWHEILSRVTVIHPVYSRDNCSWHTPTRKCPTVNVIVLVVAFEEGNLRNLLEGGWRADVQALVLLMVNT